MGEQWQVIASREVRRFPWLRRESESVVLYDGVTQRLAQTLAEMLNRQHMGVCYEARAKEQKGQSNDVHAE